MMSTEYSPHPSSGMTSTTASIVEVEASNDESLFKLKRPPSLSSDTDELMMTEYDEDNVVVIDLTEDRNSASVKQRDDGQRPRNMFGNGEEPVVATPNNGDEKVELAAPRLQKTITEDEDVRSFVLEQPHQFQAGPIMRPESDTLPPVVALKGSPKKSSASRVLLQRSKTISVPDTFLDEDNEEKSGLNGSSHHDRKTIWSHDTTDTAMNEENDESRSWRRRRQQQRKQHKSNPQNHAITIEPHASSSADNTVQRLSRRSASCRRYNNAENFNRPMTTTTFNLMSMSMIGNNLSGGYGEVDAYERRRKARSNDFLDRIDISVVSTRSAVAATSKRRPSPKMSRIEHGLFLGSLEAATDVILLESNAISHLITVDSIPLPRKITSLMPRIAMLHLQVTDLPEEDLLSYFPTTNAFIEDGLSKDGAVLVHCYRGRSRSATVVVAFLMQKHGYSAERALAKVRSRREIIQPHESFLAQLKLFENMDYTLDPGNLQFKMFRLHCASEKMRKAKRLCKEILDSVIDADPGSGSLPGSAVSNTKRYPSVYKCRKCRRTLATAFNLMPHLQDESPVWTASKWSLPAEDVMEAASEAGLHLCSASVFINPVRWMEPEIRQNLSGKLYCPNCQARVGQYSWVLGGDCGGCEAKVNPAFSLDVTEIIFRTKNRFLQSAQREPVVV